MEDTPRRITAKQMALAGGVNCGTFIHSLNRAVRRGEIGWHRYGCRWEATMGSPEHRDLQRIIAPLLLRKSWRMRP